MEAVVNNKPYIQQFPLIQQIRQLKKKLIRNNYGIKLFIMHGNLLNPEYFSGIPFSENLLPDCYADLGFKTISTNPCGEIPLCAYDSCRLLAINLYSYVDNPFTDNASFNSELFVKHVGHAQRIMDDIIDLELEKIDMILR